MSCKERKLEHGTEEFTYDKRRHINRNPKVKLCIRLTDFPCSA